MKPPIPSSITLIHPTLYHSPLPLLLSHIPFVTPPLPSPHLSYPTPSRSHHSYPYHIHHPIPSRPILLTPFHLHHSIQLQPQPHPHPLTPLTTPTKNPPLYTRHPSQSLPFPSHPIYLPSPYSLPKPNPTNHTLNKRTINKQSIPQLNQKNRVQTYLV